MCIIVAPGATVQPASSAKLTELEESHCHKKSAILCLTELPIASERRITLRLCHNLLQDPGKHWLRPAFTYRTFGDVWKPVEEVLSTLSGVNRMSSESSTDSARVRLEFNWGKDLDVVRMQVREKMDQVAPMLPEDTGHFIIISLNTNDIPVVEGRISAAGVDLSAKHEFVGRSRGVILVM